MEAAAVLEQQSPPAALGTYAWPVRILLVLAFASLLFLARLGERALWSEEVRWAEIPRAMQASGNWLQPTINGKTYYDKPLGSYWLVLFASVIVGELGETSARLPSAVCGLVGVLLAMLIARRLYGADAAILTGVILATSFAFVFFSRNACADIENVTGVLAALWIFLRNEARPPGLWTLFLWLVMALTSLTKGLLGFVLPILIIGLYSTFAPPRTTESMRAWIAALLPRNRWLFNRLSLLAIPLAALVYLGPFLLSIVVADSTEGLEMVYRENIRRFFDPVNHRGPIYLYGYVIFLLLAPWSALLPAALVEAHGAADKEGRGRAFALAYFWGTFVFFTLSASRRSYYLLPILPAAAFLIARLLTRRGPVGRLSYVLLRTGFFLIALIVLASALALVPAAALLPDPWDRLPALPAPAAFVVLWLLCAASVGCALSKPELRRIAWCFSIIASSFMIYLYLFALPAVEAYRTQKPFADAVKAAIGADMDRLALYRTRAIVFYLDSPVPLAEYHTPEDLVNGVDEGRVRWIILRRRDWESLEDKGSPRISETVQPWEGAVQIGTKLLLVEVGSRSRARSAAE